MFGFSFNTRYFADEFDDKGNLIALPEKVDRIDCGYGLNKMNSTNFSTKK
jgi:hypothetical protein